MIKTFRPLFFIVLALALTAATRHDACDEAQLKGTRYYGAIRAALKIGALQIADVERAMRSEEPHDPFQHVTPLANQIVAKRLFADLVRDPKVRETWNQTRSRLKTLLEKEQDLDTIRGAAERATTRLLAPQAIRSLHLENEHDGLAFAQLPAGETGFAHRLPKPANEFAVTTPDGRELLRMPLPAAAANVDEWVFGWHRDRQGVLWLYMSGGRYIADDETELYVYRLKWGTTKLLAVITQNYGVSPRFFLSVGHKMLLFTNGIRLDATADYTSVESTFETPAPQSSLYDGNGELIVKASHMSPGNEIVFQTRKGEVFEFSGSTQQFKYRRFPDGNWKILDAYPGRSYQLLAHETEDGRLLVAQITMDANSTAILSIFAPLSSSAKPIFRREIPTPWRILSMHWMKGPRGETLLGFAGANHVYFADFERETVSAAAIEGVFGRWFSGVKSTYFWTKSADILRLYDIAGEVAR